MSTISRGRVGERRNDGQGGWWRLRDAIMDHPSYVKLKLVELRLLFALLKYADEGGRCWPSLKTLARYTVPSFNGETVPSQVLAALKSLEAKGFVKVKRGGGRGKSNVYRVRVPSETSVEQTDVRRAKNIGKTNRKNIGESRRKHRSNSTRNIGEIHRSNSYSTAKRTPTRTPQEGVGVDGVGLNGSDDDDIYRGFKEFGVRQRLLIKRALKPR